MSFILIYDLMISYIANIEKKQRVLSLYILP